MQRFQDTRQGSENGPRAGAWAAKSGRIGVIDLPPLAEVRTFNLAERRADRGYDLILRTDAELQEQRLPARPRPSSGGVSHNSGSMESRERNGVAV
jgi:hypothetical protein